MRGNKEKQDQVNIAPISSQEKQWIDGEQAKFLYGQGRLIMLATILFSAFLVIALRDVIPRTILLTWFSLLMLLMVLRYLLILLFKLKSTDLFSSAQWVNLFTLGQFFNGLFWGATAFWLFPEKSLTHQVILIIVLVGMVAGGLGSYSNVFKVIMAFTVPTLIPMIAKLLTIGEATHLTIAIAGMLFTIIIISNARRVSNVAASSLKFQFQNRELIGVMTKDKERTERLNLDLTTKIEESERAHEALRESELKYRELVQNASSIILRFDTEGYLTFFNEYAEVFFGYKADEIIGKNVISTIVPETDTAGYDLKAMIRDIGLSPEKYSRNENENVRRDGERVWISWANTAIRDANGNIAEVLSVGNDISEKKRAEEALKESERRFRVIFEQAAVGVAQTETKTGRFQRVNEKYCNIVGYTQDELKETTFMAITHPDDLQKDLDKMQSLQKDEIREFSQEKRYIRKDGSIVWVNLSVSPMWGVGEEPNHHITIVEDITERKQAEQALRESEERYRTVFENTGTATWIIEGDATLSMVNSGTEKITGFTKDEIEGKMSWRDFIHKEDLDRLNEYHVKRRTEGEDVPAEYEFRLVDRFGEIKDIWVKVALIPGTQKSVASLADITERKQAEKALRESEERYRAVIENTGTATSIVEEDRTLSLVNAEFEKLTGYSKEEIEGKMTWADFVAPEDVERMKQYHEKRRQKGSDIPTEYVFHLLDKYGATKNIWNKVALIPGTKKSVASWMDITERNQAEEALRESEERLKSVMEAAPDPVVIYDMEGKVTYLNPAFTTVFGWTLEESLGKRTNFVPEENMAETIDAVKRMLQGEIIQSFETKRLTKEGRKIDIQVSSSTYFDQEGQPEGSVVILRDVTERQRMASALKEAKEAAEDANKAKSDFLASMSHEIRTPMNAIIGMADLLQETSLTPEQQQYVQVFSSAGENLLSIINDILDISKIEAGHLELEAVGFDLTELAETTCDVLAFKAHERGLELACNITPEIPATLIGDPVRLRQIIMNLIGNAVKFTEQGEVTLEVTKKSLESADSDSGDIELLFSVADTGIGIPPDKIDGIFDSFKQADSSTTRKHGGTGLGLSISKRLVGLMGGGIGAESEIGKGSTFYFTAKFPAQVVPKEVIEQVPVDLKDLKVLVVDDNATNRTILRETLNRWGALVSEAENGKIAFEVIKRTAESGDPFKLLLLDSIMPDMNGFQVMQHIKEQLDVSGMTIMMLTSDRRSQDIARCKELGIASYLVKPVKRAELFEAITNALGTKKVVTREPADKKPAVQEPLPPIHILLVEDNEDNVLLFKSFLKKTPCKLDFAENGQIAVEKFVSGKYDLVLMDMQMPVKDGYTATREIREWENEKGLEGIPIVALTAYATKEEEQKSLDAGCNAHLTKPIKKAKLLEAIRVYFQ